MQDITAPKQVEIRIRGDGSVVWVNVDGKCALRCCGVGEVFLEDERGCNGRRNDLKQTLKAGDLVVVEIPVGDDECEYALGRVKLIGPTTGPGDQPMVPHAYIEDDIKRWQRVDISVVHQLYHEKLKGEKS